MKGRFSVTGKDYGGKKMGWFRSGMKPEGLVAKGRHTVPGVWADRSLAVNKTNTDTGRTTGCW